MSERDRITTPLPEGAGDWTCDELAAALDAASEWTVRYRDSVDSFPVFPRVEPGEIRSRLAACPPRTPEPLERILDDMDDIIVPGLTHWNHPGFFAYFASSARGPSVIAELLIAAVGVNAMLWRTSPAATELELVVVDWLRQVVGLPEGFTGMILDTASTSSFTAVLAARERADPTIREAGVAGAAVPLRSYVSDQAHSSV
ncbi:MAG: pyridoxal-dependent decarboxylase, partial [Gemmatimonadota bacterium]|nr:pyridoxal-dependent decarboxylase [Gemmatimonadota bacterium]